MIDLHQGDCLTVMRGMADNSVDSIVTDPPYGLAFMGKKWDHNVPSVEIWAECLRVLKPGGHLLSFGGSRTYHRLTCSIEDAGFEIRDQIMWLYGSGFPKSHDVSKGIYKAAGIWRGKAGGVVSGNGAMSGGNYERTPKGDPATDAAQQWQGWGTALKPAHEPICVARKPLVGTVAANVLAHGTGALNIDGCRVNSGPVEVHERTGNITDAKSMSGKSTGSSGSGQFKDGRWPANLIHDGSEEVLAGFPTTTSGSRAEGVRSGLGGDRVFASTSKGDGGPALIGSTGSAARFFYCAKASKQDRDEGLDGFIKEKTNDGRPIDADNAYQRGATERANFHPTVKPTNLMRYLCRLVTPPGGIVLDPFMGSGSTGKAAKLEGFGFVGIELDADYVEIARARIG